MKKILFISTLIFILIIVFILYIFISNIRQSPEETVREIPLPTESQIRPTEPTPTAAPLNPEEPLIEQIIARLPVSTDTYNIEYLSTSNTFVITIKESPFEQNSEAARQWFIDNGFSSTEGLNIIYNSYSWVE